MEAKGSRASESCNESDESNSARICKSFVIIVSFVALVIREVRQGMGEAARGPCLLDLADLYKVTVDTISYGILAQSAGGLIGSFLTGWLFKWCMSCKSLLLFVFTGLYGILTSLIPYMGSPRAFFGFCAVVGLLGGALSTGGNIYCLELWRGFEGGPWMHGVHFGYALGALMAPLLAAPFLSTEEESHDSGAVGRNESLSLKKLQGETQITYLYPYMGLAIMTVSVGYLLFGISELKRIFQEKRPDKVVSVEESVNKRYLYTVIVPLGLFFFVYVGVEVTFGNFLTAFGVNSRLGLSRAQGAHLTAVFWATFTGMRFCAIFAAIKLNPEKTLALSFTLSILGASILFNWAQHSLPVLRIGTALIGLGSATIYATGKALLETPLQKKAVSHVDALLGLLWLESHVHVTSHIGSFFSIMSSLGPKTFPVLIAQVIESQPMMLMYMTLGMFLLCLVLFLFAALNAEALRRKQLFELLQTFELSECQAARVNDL